MASLSRREFTTLAVSVAATPLTVSRAIAGPPALTAADLLERVKAHLGVPWKAETVDGVKAGDAATVATGVVTTALPTLAVLREAVHAGANVVVTGEPAFYGRQDSRTPPAGRGGGTDARAVTAQPPDPVYAGKNALIDQHKLVIVRIGDHWRLRQPDPLVQGIADANGWTKYQVAGEPRVFEVPPLTVEALLAVIATQLRTRGGIRVVGDPSTRLRRIGLLPGSTPIQAALQMLPAVDAVVAGEVREWESVEYARDTIADGAKKALILTGRIVSEDPGMNVCAAWLRTFVPEVPIRHIAAGDPYWRPA